MIASPWLSSAKRAERDAVPSSLAGSVSKMGGGPGGGGGGGGGERQEPLVRTDLMDMGDATGPCLRQRENISHTVFQGTLYHNSSYLLTSLNTASSDDSRKPQAQENFWLHNRM